MDFIILKDSFDGEDVVIFGDYIQFDVHFWDITKNSKTDLMMRGFRETNKDFKEKWQQILDAMKSGKGNATDSDLLPYFAINYVTRSKHALTMKDEERERLIAKMRQVIVDSGNARCALSWCEIFGKDKELRQMVLDSNNPRLTYYYHCNVEPDDDMRQVIIDNQSTEFALYWCLNHQDDKEMRQIVVNGCEPQWAYYYCLKVDKEDEEMRQIILNGNEPKWAYWYCRDVNKSDEQMKEIADTYDYP